MTAHSSRLIPVPLGLRFSRPGAADRTVYSGESALSTVSVPPTTSPSSSGWREAPGRTRSVHAQCISRVHRGGLHRSRSAAAGPSGVILWRPAVLRRTSDLGPRTRLGSRRLEGDVGSGRYGTARAPGAPGQLAGRDLDLDSLGGGRGQGSGETGRQLSVHTSTETVQHIQGETKSNLVIRSSFILRMTYPQSSVTPPLAGPSGRRSPGT